MPLRQFFLIHQKLINVLAAFLKGGLSGESCGFHHVKLYLIILHWRSCFVSVGGHYLMRVHFAVHKQCATTISNKQGCYLVFVSGTKCLVVLMEIISFFTSLPTQTIIRKKHCMLSNMRFEMKGMKKIPFIQ